VALEDLGDGVEDVVTNDHVLSLPFGGRQDQDSIIPALSDSIYLQSFVPLGVLSSNLVLGAISSVCCDVVGGGAVVVEGKEAEVEVEVEEEV
jgi:hypothetical protein